MPRHDRQVARRNDGRLTPAQCRREAKQRIDALSRERLSVALDFLRYLEERESGEATEELLRIPGFLAALRKGEQDVAAGRITPVEKLRRK